MRLDSKGEYWFRRQELQASSKPEYLGPGTLARSEYARCDGHFYLHKKEPKGQKNRRSRCRIERKSQIRDGHSSAKEPWLIFSSTNDFKPREIMKLYSRRMQIEQNFRDEKSEGTVAKLAMRQPFVLFKGLTFQKLCLPGAFRPGDHHNKMLRPGLCVVHASPQYL